MRELTVELIGLIADRSPAILFLTRRNKQAVGYVTCLILGSAVHAETEYHLSNHTSLRYLTILYLSEWRHVMDNIPMSLRHLRVTGRTLTQSEAVRLPPLLSLDLTVESDENVFGVLDSLPSSLTNLVVRSSSATSIVIGTDYFVTHPDLIRVEGVIVTSRPDEPDVNLTRIESIEATPYLIDRHMPNLGKLILNCHIVPEVRMIEHLPYKSLQILCVCDWEVTSSCVNSLSLLKMLYAIMKPEELYGIKVPIVGISVLLTDITPCVLVIDRLPKSIENACVSNITDIQLDKTKPHPNLYTLSCDAHMLESNTVELPDSITALEMLTSHPHFNYATCYQMHSLVLSCVVWDNLSVGSLNVLPPHLESLTCNTQGWSPNKWEMSAPCELPSTLTYLTLPSIPHFWRNNKEAILSVLTLLKELHIESMLPHWVASHLSSLTSLSCVHSDSLYELPRPQQLESLTVSGDLGDSINQADIEGLESFFPNAYIDSFTCADVRNGE